MMWHEEEESYPLPHGHEQSQSQSQHHQQQQPQSQHQQPSSFYYPSQSPPSFVPPPFPYGDTRMSYDAHDSIAPPPLTFPSLDTGGDISYGYIQQPTPMFPSPPCIISTSTPSPSPSTWTPMNGMPHSNSYSHINGIHINTSSSSSPHPYPTDIPLNGTSHPSTPSVLTANTIPSSSPPITITNPKSKRRPKHPSSSSSSSPSYHLHIHTPGTRTPIQRSLTLNTSQSSYTWLQLLQTIVDVDSCDSITCDGERLDPHTHVIIPPPSQPIHYTLSYPLKSCTRLGCTQLYASTSSRRACQYCMTHGYIVPHHLICHIDSRVICHTMESIMSSHIKCEPGTESNLTSTSLLSIIDRALTQHTHWKFHGTSMTSSSTLTSPDATLHIVFIETTAYHAFRNDIIIQTCQLMTACHMNKNDVRWNQITYAMDQMIQEADVNAVYTIKMKSHFWKLEVTKGNECVLYTKIGKPNQRRGGPKIEPSTPTPKPTRNVRKSRTTRKQVTEHVAIEDHSHIHSPPQLEHPSPQPNQEMPIKRKRNSESSQHSQVVTPVNVTTPVPSFHRVPSSSSQTSSTSACARPPPSHPPPSHPSTVHLDLSTYHSLTRLRHPVSAIMSIHEHKDEYDISQTSSSSDSPSGTTSVVTHPLSSLSSSSDVVTPNTDSPLSPDTSTASSPPIHRHTSTLTPTPPTAMTPSPIPTSPANPPVILIYRDISILDADIRAGLLQPPDHDHDDKHHHPHSHDDNEPTRKRQKEERREEERRDGGGYSGGFQYQYQANKDNNINNTNINISNNTNTNTNTTTYNNNHNNNQDGDEKGEISLPSIHEEKSVEPQVSTDLPIVAPRHPSPSIAALYDESSHSSSPSPSSSPISHSRSLSRSPKKKPTIHQMDVVTKHTHVIETPPAISWLWITLIGAFTTLAVALLIGNATSSSMSYLTTTSDPNIISTSLHQLNITSYTLMTHMKRTSPIFHVWADGTSDDLGNVDVVVNACQDAVNTAAALSQYILAVGGVDPGFAYNNRPMTSERITSPSTFCRSINTTVGQLYVTTLICKDDIQGQERWNTTHCTNPINAFNVTQCTDIFNYLAATNLTHTALHVVPIPTSINRSNPPSSPTITPVTPLLASYDFRMQATTTSQACSNYYQSMSNAQLLIPLQATSYVLRDSLLTWTFISTPAILLCAGIIITLIWTWYQRKNKLASSTIHVQDHAQKQSSTINDAQDQVRVKTQDNKGVVTPPPRIEARP